MNESILKLIDELKRGQYDIEKIESFTETLRDYTEESDLELLFVLGDMLMQLGDTIHALNIFEYLYSEVGHDDNLLSYIVEIYIVDNRLDDALLLINDAEKTPTVLMLKSELFQQMNLNDVALKALYEARELSDDMVIDFAIAELLYYKGDINDAIRFYQNVLEHDVDKVNNINIHQRLADIYVNQMDFEDALSHLNQVDESEYTNDDFYLKSIIYYYLERYEEAEKTLMKVVSNEPYYTNAYVLLMKVYEENYEYDKAYQLLEDYVVLDKENANIFYNLGRLAIRLGKVDKANESFRKATALDETYDDAYRILFQNLLTDDTPEDIEHYLPHIDTDNLTPQSLHLLANIEALNENDEEASKYYETAYSYLSDDIDFLYDYYQYLLEIRNPKYLDVLNKLIKLDSNNTDLALELERLRGEEDEF
ncbi:MAG TPA: tetratricopeptide repeat protein [Jeotgalicoccus sp.]|nr:tetratricopeptide repeat protein [Jeotgalicoccus sp.]